MKRYFIELSYDGTRYNGWQAQPQSNTVTVQGEVQKFLSIIQKENIQIIGCGRTDAGVHARGYYAHFDTEVSLEASLVVYKLNKMLSSDIAIHDVFEVNGNAHARYDALERTYQYKLHTKKQVFDKFSFFYKYEQPKLDLLNEFSQVLMNYVDFTPFAKLHGGNQTNLCKLTRAHWEKIDDNYIFTITSDRFLRGMIRLIVGACLQFSRGKLELKHIHNAMEQKSKLPSDWSVPAVGLTLCDIKYDWDNLKKINTAIQ